MTNVKALWQVQSLSILEVA